MKFWLGTLAMMAVMTGSIFAIGGVAGVFIEANPLEALFNMLATWVWFGAMSVPFWLAVLLAGLGLQRYATRVFEAREAREYECWKKKREARGVAKKQWASVAKAHQKVSEKGLSCTLVPADGVGPSSPLYEGGALTVELRRPAYASIDIEASDEREMHTSARLARPKPRV